MEKKGTKQKIIRLLITAAMMFVMFPINSMADEVDNFSFISLDGFIYDNNNNFVKSWEFNKSDLIAPLSTNDAKSAYRRYNRKTVGAFFGELVHEAVLRAFRSESFGEFQSFEHDVFHIENWSYFSIGEHGSSVRPQNNTWSAVRVDVMYSCSVVAVLSLTLSIAYSGVLIEAGFSVSGNFTYMKYMTNSYSLSVY